MQCEQTGCVLSSEILGCLLFLFNPLAGESVPFLRKQSVSLMLSATLAASVLKESAQNKKKISSRFLLVSTSFDSQPLVSIASRMKVNVLLLFLPSVHSVTHDSHYLIHLGR